MNIIDYDLVYWCTLIVLFTLTVLVAIFPKKEIKQKIYTYKGERYIILGEVQMKDIIIRSWYKAIHYKQMGNLELTFVREEEEFFKLFKLEE